MLKHRNLFFDGISPKIPLSEFLGNSVAIPCVDHVLRGVAYFLEEEGDDDA